MFLRKTCYLNSRKRVFGTRISLLDRTLVCQSKIIQLNSMDSSLNEIKYCAFLNKLKRSNSLRCSKINFHIAQNFNNKNNNGKTSEKSTQPKKEIKNTQAGDKNVSPQNKNTKAAKGKIFTFSKFNAFKSRLRSRKTRICVYLLGLASLYYVTHLVVNPISKRRKFHLLSEHQLNTLAELQSDRYRRKYKDRIETSGTSHNRVAKVINTLIKANGDLPGASDMRSWSIFVVDNISSVHAVVLTNGHIYVYSGLLEAVDDDDHLAAFLAHGVAHVLLDHYAQIPTWLRTLLLLMVHPLVAVYGILPAFIRSPLSPIMRPLSSVCLKLPLGKKLEREADRLSIEIVSKACFDPRKVKEFWTEMADLRKSRRVKCLRVHPLHHSRYANFDSQMPKAFNILHKNCAGNLHPFFR